ncbi:UDP-glucose--hexose-1-phosphate uridylyltransferase [Pseudoneobacillus sp. C159]
MIFGMVGQLLNKAIDVNLIEKDDEIYARNQVLSLLDLEDYPATNQENMANRTIPDILEEIVTYAAKNNIIPDESYLKEIFVSKIMNCFLSKPSEVNKTFYEKYQQSPKMATDFFYLLSQNSNYIQTKALSKNIQYQVHTEYGALDITINLAKPEKDPKQIEKERAMKSLNYPKCLLCIENEGYQGRPEHPARSNHRMIRMDINGGNWLFQFSPYLYYPEHSILLSEEHRRMRIDQQTFANLLAFVEKFPHYFIGSNADLPIVGGSILSHDHYQAGNYEFAMAKAEEEFQVTLRAFPDIEATILKWPMSVIRIKHREKERLMEASSHILEKWRHYHDSSVQILAFSNRIPHNTITPIARRRNELYELDLVLRNNRTDATHPLGIFHPHQDVQHIKKENIGLIEAMGLAVLPARLKHELQEVEKFLLNQPHQVADYHLQWAVKLAKQYDGLVSAENVEHIVRQEVGQKFLKVLGDAGVFKRNKVGMNAFKRFIDTLNE